MTKAKPSATKEDIEANKMIAAIGYLGPLCLVPLLLKKKSAYAQFHGKQGFVLLVVWVILLFINIIPLLGQIIWFLGSIALLILMILGIVNALNGNLWEMPVLGAYADKLNF